MRFDAGIASAEMAVATALAYRELGEAPLFLLPFYPRELGPDERAMNGSLFEFHRRFAAFAISALLDIVCVVVLDTLLLHWPRSAAR